MYIETERTTSRIALLKTMIMMFAIKIYVHMSVHNGGVFSPLIFLLTVADSDRRTGQNRACFVEHQNP